MQSREITAEPATLATTKTALTRVSYARARLTAAVMATRLQLKILAHVSVTRTRKADIGAVTHAAHAPSAIKVKVRTKVIVKVQIRVKKVEDRLGQTFFNPSI